MDAEIYKQGGIFVGGALLTLLGGLKVKRSQDARIDQLEADMQAALKRLSEMPDRQDQLEHRQNITTLEFQNLQADVVQDRGYVQRAVREIRDKWNDAFAIIVQLEEKLARGGKRS